MGERKLLSSCYRESLNLARDAGCESVAFPLISAGAYGYPRDRALDVAVETIGAFLRDHEMTVYLVVFDRASFQIGEQRFQAIESYIDDHYVDLRLDTSRRVQNVGFPPPPAPMAYPQECAAPGNLREALAFPRCSCGKSTKRA